MIGMTRMTRVLSRDGAPLLSCLDDSEDSDGPAPVLLLSYEIFGPDWDHCGGGKKEMTEGVKDPKIILGQKHKQARSTNRHQNSSA